MCFHLNGNEQRRTVRALCPPGFPAEPTRQSRKKACKQLENKLLPRGLNKLEVESGLPAVDHHLMELMKNRAESCFLLFINKITALKRKKIRRGEKDVPRARRTKKNRPKVLFFGRPLRLYYTVTPFFFRLSITGVLLALTVGWRK